jgi:DNA-binding NtrC family response regulator
MDTTMSSKSILVIDDDTLFLRTLQQQIESLGFGVFTADDGKEAQRLVEAEDYGLILLDLRFGELRGLDLLRKWKEINPALPVVMVSGQGTIPEAVEALKAGALDFLVKPVDINILELVIRRTLDSQTIYQENVRLKQLTKTDQGEYLGRSIKVQKLLSDAEKIAVTDHPVLLEGETGTGKQVLAKFICAQSPRSNEPFIRLNCAAISETLFESELFGHEKGAFTGAVSRKPGKLELVGHGTLFLDEIGELPISCQAKLLTAVEDRIFERVGGTKTLSFEGRIIAATNRNLEKEVTKGNFREDLFYRLNTFRLILPPLRDHSEDIPLYIEHTLKRCSRQYNRRFDSPDEDTCEKLLRYSWPGNIRELIHHIERIALFSSENKIPTSLWLSFPQATLETEGELSSDLKDAIRAFKNQHVNKVLTSCGGNQTLAAKKLGIERTYLNRLLSQGDLCQK